MKGPHRSGKPEPVFTNDQWGMLRNGGNGLRDGDQITLVVEDTPLTATVHRVLGAVAPSRVATHAALA